ncbi:MAG: DUF4388 domain-containing protein [Gemmatimonadota bacterium]|nr:DUF4388 domain-containing protein [Gemmatimonadota bacterium]
MAIEGPLRELGIHDVFQILDLSRKTGTLHVTSELRDNSGRVLFRQGRVVGANIKSHPLRIGDLLLKKGRATEADITRALAAQREGGGQKRLGDFLIDFGVISAKELEREVRSQIENVIFDLLSWSEGFFRFEDGGTPEHEGSIVNISTESLLMEGARRIDEWSRIADRVPSLACVPSIADVDEGEAPRMDLLPNEWEVLTMIDGARDLRQISDALVRSDFDVARIVYGLVSTGVVSLKVPGGRGSRRSTARVLTPGTQQAVSATPDPTPADGVPVDDLARGFAALRVADFDTVVKAWAQFLQTHPYDDRSPQVRQGLDAALKLRAMLEAPQS